MTNRMTWLAKTWPINTRSLKTWPVTSTVATIIVVSGLIYQPSHAQTTTPQATAPGAAQTTAQGAAQTTAQTAAQGTANECLARPGKTTPRGSHWYYRLERPSGRRCWYLGSAGAKVRRSATGQNAVPTPVPRPAQEEPAEQIAADTPAPDAQETTAQDMAAAPTDAANAASANAALAADFAATWPTVPDSGESNDRDATAAAGSDNAEPFATAEAQSEQADMPLVWPAMTPAEAANAAQPSESTPGVASLVMFLAAAGAFVAIAFRTVLQFWSGRFAHRMRRPVVAPAAPIVRPHAPSAPSRSDPSRERFASGESRKRFASEESIEAMTEPTITRLREIAARWDSPRHMPRAPRVAPYDEMPEAEHEAPAPRPRRVVA
ncbi:MAG: hypothetical protein GEU95_09375 [Rhizobiales bacterium]|nr:hypothetical protein [Hyphomicrobiales bacterium]